MTFRTTPQADLDIADIYVAGARQFGVEQAERYQDGLFHALGLLATNPLMARLRREFRPPVRLYRFKAHMVVYINEDTGVLIVRVLHGRQDWERHLS